MQSINICTLHTGQLTEFAPLQLTERLSFLFDKNSPNRTTSVKVVPIETWTFGVLILSNVQFGIGWTKVADWTTLDDGLLHFSAFYKVIVHSIDWRMESLLSSQYNEHFSAGKITL